MRIKKKIALLLTAAMLVTSVNISPFTVHAEDGGSDNTTVVKLTKYALPDPKTGTTVLSLSKAAPPTPKTGTTVLSLSKVAPPTPKTGTTVLKLSKAAPPQPKSGTTLVKLSKHVHDWEYTANGATLTAECVETAGTCSVTSNSTLTLTASSPNYAGTAATITIGTETERTAWTEAGLTVPEIISYENEDGTSLTSAPAEAGSYAAKVSPVGETASETNTAKISYIIKPNHGADTTKFESDGTNHWNPCLRDDCEDATHKYNTEAHSGGTATCQVKAVCDTCENEFGEYGNHDWSAEWTTSAGSHWHACQISGCTAANGTASHTGGTATCTDKAKCEVCDTEYGQAPGHIYEEQFTIDVIATCTNDGSMSRHCSADGCSAKTDVTVVEAFGHRFGEWTVRTAPTETAEGVEYRVCGRCNSEETRSIDKIVVTTTVTTTTAVTTTVSETTTTTALTTTVPETTTTTAVTTTVPETTTTTALTTTVPETTTTTAATTTVPETTTTKAVTTTVPETTTTKAVTTTVPETTTTKAVTTTVPETTTKAVTTTVPETTTTKAVTTTVPETTTTKAVTTTVPETTTTTAVTTTVPETTTTKAVTTTVPETTTTKAATTTVPETTTTKAVTTTVPETTTTKALTTTVPETTTTKAVTTTVPETTTTKAVTTTVPETTTTKPVTTTAAVTTTPVTTTVTTTPVVSESAVPETPVKHEGTPAGHTVSGTRDYYEFGDKFYEDEGCTKEIANLDEWIVIPAEGHRFSKWHIILMPAEGKDGEKRRECEICGLVQKEYTSYNKPEEERPSAPDAGIVENITDPEKNAFEGNVVITRNELLDTFPLSTEEAELVENGSDIGLALDVKDITEDLTEDKANEAASLLTSDEKIGAVLDVSIFKYIDGEYAGRVTNLKKLLKILIALPDELISPDRTYQLIREHNGKFEKIALVHEYENMFSFLSDKFSSYYIAYEDHHTVHEFENAWTNDETAHWHVASCSHSNEIGSYSAHVFGEWKITKAPDTENITDGEKSRTCEVCGFTETEAAEPYIPFRYGDLDNDGNITVKDLVSMIRYYHNAENYTAELTPLELYYIRNAGDIWNDGNPCSEADIIMMERYLVHDMTEEYFGKYSVPYFRAGGKYYSDSACTKEITDLEQWIFDITGLKRSENTQTENRPSEVPGDLTGDGIVTAADLVAIMEAAAAEISDPVMIRKGDLDGDGKPFTAEDIRMLKTLISVSHIIQAPSVPEVPAEVPDTHESAAGDLNDDGIVDAADLVSMMHYCVDGRVSLAGQSEYSILRTEKSGDLNGDGITCSAADIILLKKLIMKKK